MKDLTQVIGIDGQQEQRAIIAAYHAMHRPGRARRPFRSTADGPAPAKLWKPSQTSACMIGEGSERPGKYSAIVKKLA